MALNVCHLQNVQVVIVQMVFVQHQQYLKQMDQVVLLELSVVAGIASLHHMVHSVLLQLKVI